MCGIAGIIYQREIPVEREAMLKSMLTSIVHRGPDDEGMYFDGPVAMGHRRLSILDLSPAGHQPMEYRGYVIVYNGEIYNYLELREDLKKLGHVFITGTDTEVVLASYSEWGEQCVNYFNGDWAFAIYDKKRKSLFLSRDRYGIKPLYYYHSDLHKVYVFASEIKALTRLPFIPNSPNTPKCYEYLVFALLDHEKETLHRDIYQVEPGSNITVDLRTLRIKHASYYLLNYEPNLGKYSRAKALFYADTIRDLLIDSVKLRLRADVPIGTCLSGGLDSSTIVVIMNKLLHGEGVASAQLGSQLKTFTASFPNETIDESKYAKCISSYTNAEEHFIYPTTTDIDSEVNVLMWSQDEPFGSASIYSQWKVMEKASKHVKVILDGQGGDELFGGYAHYRSAFLSQLLTRGKFITLARELYKTTAMYDSFTQMALMLKGFPLYVVPDRLKKLLYLRWKRNLERDALDKINVAEGYVPRSFITSSFVPNLNVVLQLHQMKYSLQQLLRYEDRNSMAFSIESRTPFTDYRLVDFIFSIPAIYKHHNGWSKWLLRLAMRDLLPKEILWRKDKIGFEVSKTMKVYNRFRIYDVWLDSMNNRRVQSLS